MNLILVSIFLAFSSADALASPQKTYSLDDVYRMALMHNEDIGIDEQRVKQAEELYSQAKGTLFPTVNFVGTYLKQGNPPAGTAASLSPSTQQVYKLTATQPIFHGFREWNGLSEQRNLTESAEITHQQTLINIFLNIAQSYYQVILAEENLRDFTRTTQLNNKRLGELRRFRQLGRNRQSDVLSLEASLAQIDAQTEATQAALMNAKSALAILTGVEKEANFVDNEVFPATLPPLDAFLSKIDQTPTVAAAQKSADAASDAVGFARGGHLPYLDLSANYYFKRPGAYSDVKWDAQLNLTFPIFQGGVVSSQVRAAADAQKAADLTLEKARRTARETIENLYAQILSDFRQMSSQKRAADLTEKNYQAELRDYRLGLVTNIEVLQAQSNEQTALLNYNQAHYTFKTDYLKLLGSVADRPVRR